VIESFLGLEIWPVPGLRLTRDIDGMICHHLDGSYSIAIDQDILDHNPHRYRFTLGEEVGHYVLHADFLPKARTIEQGLAAYRTMLNWHQLDRNARRFAAAALMPMRTLVPNAERVYAELVRAVGLRDPDAVRKHIISLLSKSYGVSPEAMRYRLKEYPARLDKRIDQALRERLDILP
jgi:Zn-dependent peptidase ImmA (M78 family)